MNKTKTKDTSTGSFEDTKVFQVLEVWIFHLKVPHLRQGFRFAWNI